MVVPKWGNREGGEGRSVYTLTHKEIFMTGKSVASCSAAQLLSASYRHSHKFGSSDDGQ